MTEITQLCRVIRSKNAGPFEITFDLIFKDRTGFERAKNSGVFTKQNIARLYKRTEEEILHLVFYEAANAIKITMKRTVSSGTVGETDTYGAQQHAPLLSLKI